MANETLSIVGSHKKAISDGTALRKQIKELATKFRQILLILIGAAVLVWGGYKFSNWAWSVPERDGNPPVVNVPAPQPVEVPWSEVITVEAGEWSEPIWAAPNQCIDVVILEGAPNTVEGFRAHSMILPWSNSGKPQDWIPNNGGGFKGILLGCADTRFSFRYRFLPHKCS